MNKFLFFLLFTLCVVFGFGIWFLIVWFMTGEYNPILWEWWVKMIYLIAGVNSTNNIIDFVNKN
jgi:hypothetical protein